MTDRHSRALPGRPGRHLRLRQVHLRPAALRAHPGAVLGLLPRPGRRRRERPVRVRPTPSTCCTTSPASGWPPAGSPSSTPPTCSRTPGPAWSRSPASTTCCRSRSCWTCPSRSPGSAPRAAPDRTFGRQVLTRMHRDLRRSYGQLAREGFRKVHVLRGVDEIEAATIRYEKLFNDKQDLTGPFDIIGDVHGCRAELEHAADHAGLPRSTRRPERRAPGRAHRRVRRRPGRPRSGLARRAAPGDGHGRGRHRALRARQPRAEAGPQAARPQRAAHPRPAGDPGAAGRRGRRPSSPQVRQFIDGLVSHYVLDGGKLVVAHAGLKEAYQGRASGPGARVRAVRRDHRRDRRVRPAGPLPVGPRLPGFRRGRLRPHAHPDPGVDQQHHLPGHRLRVRRLADRAALAVPRAGVGAGRAGVLRAGPPAARPRPAATRGSTWPTSPGGGTSTTGTAGPPSPPRTPPPRWR